MDARAMQQFALPEDLLMENAGAAVFSVVAQRVGTTGRRVVFVCGTGNNGGDGLVVARRLAAAGGLPEVWIVGDPGKYSGACARNFERCRSIELPLHRLESDPSEFLQGLRGCDGVVDALFGTGLARSVEGVHRRIIEGINACDAPVISVDIPSGVDGDTGRVHGIAVRADATVTLGLPKIGNLLYPGFDFGGRLVVSSISFPRQLCEGAELEMSVNSPIALPRREVAGHKGDFGDALFVAGAASYYGAPSLAASAFLRAGGGYARLAAPKSMIPALASMAPEVVFLPQAETAEGSISPTAEGSLLEAAAEVDALVVGPGLSRNNETAELVCRLVVGTDKPMIVDGDGLSALAAKPEAAAGRKVAGRLILTPHAGELSRLIGWETARIEGDRVAASREASKRYSAAVVLKGAHSLIAVPRGRVWVNLTGNSGMATPGSGDVLAGVIAAMVGLGLSADEGARIGVLIHGLAGDIAAEKGEDGVLARDILASVPEAMRRLRVDPEGCLRGRVLVLD